MDPLGSTINVLQVRGNILAQNSIKMAKRKNRARENYGPDLYAQDALKLVFKIQISSHLFLCCILHYHPLPQHAEFKLSGSKKIGVQILNDSECWMRLFNDGSDYEYISVNKCTTHVYNCIFIWHIYVTTSIAQCTR